MRIRLAVEDIEPNHWVAWALDLPACFSAARTAADAAASAPQKISDYFDWMLSYDNLLPIVHEPIQIEIVETFHSFACTEDPDYIVNAFFEDDRRALGYWDVGVALRLLDFTRQDLSRAMQTATHEQLTTTVPNEGCGSIMGVLKHIAGAENWYFDQLDCGLQRGQLPDDLIERLAAVRANTRKQLPKLIGNERITNNCGELWSARKIVRRTLWHERAHTHHIQQLLATL